GVQARPNHQPPRGRGLAGAKVTGSGAVDESSDSEAEQEGPQKLIRKVSTSGQIRSKTSIKEGLLLKQTSSFQRWKKRYFKLRGRTLYYAKDAKSLIFDEVDLSDASVAESSTKNVNNSFTVITPFRRLILCAENRKEMEDWISSLKSVQSREHYETAQFNVEHFSGMHNWYACSHARPTFCNVCKDSLSGVTSHGLSCEGKPLAFPDCSTFLQSENPKISFKFKPCLLTQKHTMTCMDVYPRKCPLGQCKVSIIPPTALNSIDSDGFWKATCPPSCASPLLVFVNSKSGDNQGVKFLRRFKQLLNPAQVFDLVNGGPHLGLRLFQKFDNFRILVCGGDGSVGWVLSEIDKLNLHKQCQLGVLPLGTGNDLARVLGWGPSCDDDTQLPQILEKLERASTKMLDRWSIMTYEIKIPPKHHCPTTPEGADGCQVLTYEDSVAALLTKILNSQRHSVAISSAKILCETVKEFVTKVGKAYEKSTENTDECDSMSVKCAILNEKLESLLQTLDSDSKPLSLPSHVTPPIVEEEQDEEEEVSEESFTELKEKLEEEETEKGGDHREPPLQLFKSREQLMLRANSLKKAVRQIIEQAVRGTHRKQSHLEAENKEESTAVPSPTALSPSLPSPPVRRTFLSSTRGLSAQVTTDLLSSKASLSSKSKYSVFYANAFCMCSGLRAGLAASIAGSSIISKMLLANIDPFGATSFIDPDLDALEGYMEKCVMNNYFGIGLDAKISLEFNNKREEHPEKCRSRTKNMMWYGVLGTKELLQRTYKNLEQKVQLECDGQYIPLPSLQGIAVLNIPSYAGGTNFWGGTKEDDIFCAPSFDDKILEVVAVFGSMQMAMSRVIKLQHHRIAQCRTVKITILGDEGVPIQVDGEAWVQPPGVIKIQHKNRAQMLTRDRAFENTLKSWEDKLKYDKPPLRPHLYSQQSVDLATEEEATLVQSCARAAEELITRICEAAKTNGLLEQELAHAVNAASHAINKTHPKFPESLTRNTAIEVSSTVKALHNETESLLLGRVSLQLDPPEEEQLSNALQSVEVELGKLGDVPWLYYILQPNDEEDPSLGYGKRNSRSSVFRIVPKFKKEKAAKKTSPQSGIAGPPFPSLLSR
uniref:Diacylglycerol kinase n=1 Tax=Oryzias melastigma TaxID=30732 RepID=A0A3B3BRV4_ORYME